MATKSKQTLLNEIDAAITSNGTGAITGPVLNTVLKSLTGSLAGGYFTFPKDISLTTADIGKVVMNDGSGTAKVYQLSPALPEQLGRWVIHLNDLNEIESWANFNIDSNNGSVHFDKDDWRNGTTPTTVNEELDLIKTYIDGDPSLSLFLSVTVTGDEMEIEETTYSTTVIELDGFADSTYYCDKPSRGALPAAPTAFPLGKLVGIDGSNALISNAPVETYLTDTAITIDYDLFNNNTPVDMSSGIQGVFETYQILIIIPDSNGKVKSLDTADWALDSSFPASIRQHFIGIAIAADANSVTVINSNWASLVLNVIVKVMAKQMWD